jgi:hypothetical protein
MSALPSSTGENMTEPLREQFSNNGETTLNGGINSSVTSLTATSGAVFPSTGTFRIRIDDEIMLCTARSSNTLTVVRGVESTSAATHSNGATVSHVVTAGSLGRWGQDANAYAGSSQPPLGLIVDDDGLTLLDSSDFTLINSGSSTITDHNGTINLAVLGSSGQNWRWLSRSAPSPTYEYIAAFQIGMWNSNFSERLCSFGLRESTTNKSSVIGIEASGAASVFMGCRDSTGNTDVGNPSEGSGYFGGTSGGIVWFKVRYDGTDCKFYVSHDGIIWTQVRSVAKTTPFTTAPDTIIWGVWSNAGSDDPDTMMRLLHFSRAV